MRKTGKMIMMMLAGSAVITGTAAHADDITADIASAYVWRGQVLNDEAVLQPGFTLETPVGVYLNTWANMDLTDKFDNSGEFTEVDLTLGYTLPMPEDSIVGVEVGVIEYLFPKEGDWSADSSEGAVKGYDADTRELYAALAVDSLLSPSLSVYYDCDEVSGWYVTAGIAQGFDLTDLLSLELGVSVGWASERYNKAYFGVEDNQFNDMNIGGSLAYAVSEEISIGAGAAYTFLLDSKIRGAAKESYEDKDAFYGSLNLAYVF
jgi:uncharacterized protein (TIGR02001 family)